MKKSFALGATTAAAVCSLLSASPALAQGTPAAEPSGGLEEVVVTARYREENLQQTPIAITAITAEDIAARGFTSTSDIAYTVPNASFRPAQQAYGNTMTAYIRGVGQNDFNFAFEPGVGIYVDDVLLPHHHGLACSTCWTSSAWKCCAVRKARCSAAAPSAAPCATCRKQPRGDGTGYVEATAGDLHRLDLRRATISRSSTTSCSRAVTGVSKRQDGYQRVIDFACAFPDQAGTLPASTRNRGQGCQTGTLGGTNVQGGRVQFRFVGTETFDVNLALDYQRDDSEARADSMIGIISPGLCPPAPAACAGCARCGTRPCRTRTASTTTAASSPTIATSPTARSPIRTRGLAFPPKTSLEPEGRLGGVQLEGCGQLGREAHRCMAQLEW